MLHTKNVTITASATPTDVVADIPTGFVAFINYIMYEGDRVIASIADAGSGDVACTFDIVEASSILRNFNRVS